MGSPKNKVTENEAEYAYKKIHALAQDKQELTKAQASYKTIVKEYLSENPAGFYVLLEDARGSVHDYHVGITQTERVSIDKSGLKAKIVEAIKASGEVSYHVPSVVTPSYLARMVEQGYLSADDIEAAEDIQQSAPVKKTRIKGGRPKEAMSGKSLESGEQVQMHLDGPTLTVNRGNSVEVHRPQISKQNTETGEMEIVQQASTEIQKKDDDAPPRTWSV